MHGGIGRRRGERTGPIAIAAIGTAALAAALALSAPASPRAAGEERVATRSAKGSIDTTRLELGDGKISSGPKRGYLWACQGDPASESPAGGPWITGSTWNYAAKPTVDGDVSWPNASVTIDKSQGKRRITTNSLPTNHTSGVFPVQQSDDAYQYDPNPNTISEQSLSVELPAEPKRARSRSCVGGEVGIMLSGVILNNAVDADGSDAPAHEVPDRCGGHPERTGTYHYHALPPCLKSGRKGRHSKQIGWALDGFGIYGPLGDGGEYMENDDLDSCHGHMHEVKLEGEQTRIYHYHATMLFPYSVGCYRGTPVTTGPLNGGSEGGGGGPGEQPPDGGGGMAPPDGGGGMAPPEGGGGLPPPGGGGGMPPPGGGGGPPPGGPPKG